VKISLRYLDDEDSIRFWKLSASGSWRPENRKKLQLCLSYTVCQISLTDYWSNYRLWQGASL